METGSQELEELSREECLRLVSTAPVGRVVFTTGGLPAVEPVSFVLDGDRILFRAREGGKLAMLGGGTVVAFQADRLEIATRSGWSVTIVGQAHLLDGDEATGYLDGALHLWANGVRDDIIAIDAGMVHGRRLLQPRT